MDGYIPRIADAEIERLLKTFGAIHIVGPKWCGKTTSAERFSRSSLLMQDPDKADMYLEIARMKPSNLLEGEKPRLIDEWQVEPKLWDAVRFSVDRNQGRGMYILTGSVTPPEDEKRHTGTGRIVTVKMRTLSLFESGDSTGEVSIGSLFEGVSEVSGISGLDYTTMAELLVRGGWPSSIGSDTETASDIIMGYCEGMLDSEINLPEGRRRDKQRMRMILRSLARNTSMSVPNTTIMEDIGRSEQGGISVNTLADYISALKDIHVVDDLAAWSPRLRSKVAIRTSDVRHFVDPAIAAYFLGAGPRDLEMDPRTYGLLFESLVVRDLRIYAQDLRGDVYHYRDGDGLEVDVIIHLKDGRWGAIEVKLGSYGVDAGATNLLRLARKVDSEKMNPPSFLMVVTAVGYAYTREDGVHVVPLGCLRN